MSWLKRSIFQGNGKETALHTKNKVVEMNLNNVHSFAEKRLRLDKNNFYCSLNVGIRLQHDCLVINLAIERCLTPEKAINYVC